MSGVPKQLGADFYGVIFIGSLADCSERAALLLFGGAVSSVGSGAARLCQTDPNKTVWLFCGQQLRSGCAASDCSALVALCLAVWYSWGMALLQLLLGALWHRHTLLVGIGIVHYETKWGDGKKKNIIRERGRMETGRGMERRALERKSIVLNCIPNMSNLEEIRFAEKHAVLGKTESLKTRSSCNAK